MSSKEKEIDIREVFSQNLKYYRIKSNISQEKLSEIVGLTDKYISDIERGKTTPSFDTVDKIAETLEVDPLELLTDKYFKDYADRKMKIDEVRGRISRDKTK